MVQSVLLSGGDGALGRRVAALLEPGAFEVVDSGSEADIVVELGPAHHDRLAERGGSATDAAHDALHVSERTRHLVLVSSALAYGAWANNSLPLTEEAALRPTNEFVFARQLASIEQAVDVWRRSGDGRTAAILRPAITMGVQTQRSLAHAVISRLGERYGELDPPFQFLELDDLASAIALAVSSGLDGVFNVAPDGWIDGDRLRDLAGGGLRLPMPDRAREVIDNVRWRTLGRGTPPGMKAYARASWVIANDRLRAEGWEPQATNEQAFVAGTSAPWWTSITPQRRQEIALGVAAGAVMSVIAGLGWMIRRSIRRSR